MVTMMSKCEFDLQNGILKDYLPRHLISMPRHNFCSQYFFPTAKMTKIMKILILGPTISMSSSRYFSRVDLSVYKC